MESYLVSFLVKGGEHSFVFDCGKALNSDNAEVFVYGEIKAYLEKIGIALPVYVKDVIVLEAPTKGLVWRQGLLDIQK